MYGTLFPSSLCIYATGSPVNFINPTTQLAISATCQIGSANSTAGWGVVGSNALQNFHIINGKVYRPQTSNCNKAPTNSLMRYDEPTFQGTHVLFAENKSHVYFAGHGRRPWYVRDTRVTHYHHKQQTDKSLLEMEQSLTYLLGEFVSIDILQKVAQAVNEKGPSRMPGVCCFDTPTTSTYIGYEVSYF
jgi:hypothetical protein